MTGRDALAFLGALALATGAACLGMLILGFI